MGTGKTATRTPNRSGINQKGVNMRTIGIDLGVVGEHKAVVCNDKGDYISRVINVQTEKGSLDELIAEARRGNPQEPLQAVMEPTGMAWFPVAVYLASQGVQNYLVNSQQVADLRRYYKKHAKSDRIDARVLAKLPIVNTEHLHELKLPGATVLACQRGCKMLDRLIKGRVAIMNRLIALDRFAWPGFEKAKIFSDAFSPAASWFRNHYYNPYHVKRTGADQIKKEWLASTEYDKWSDDWPVRLEKLAEQAISLYGEEGLSIDFDLVQAEAMYEESLLRAAIEMHKKVTAKIVQPQYRKIHPQRYLETIPGVGRDGAAVFASIIGNPDRFINLRKHRGWSGMVPNSRQSSSYQASGLKITQAGPRLIKKFAYLDADMARQRDPQIAAIYYDQMVNKGKHHTQAICVCATHLLDRVLTVLRENRPYMLKDAEGNPVTKKQAREIILTKYTVPDSIRQRNKKLSRADRRDRLSEKNQKLEGKLRSNEGDAHPDPSG
jgi:transposase